MPRLSRRCKSAESQLGPKPERRATASETAASPSPESAAESFPTTADFARERQRADHAYRTRRATVEVLGFIAIAAAVAVLVSTLAFPLFRIYGDSMSPTLVEGNVVVANKVAPIERGNLEAFYLNNKILVKRVIGLPGDWVDIAQDGTVTVNGQPIDESYLQPNERAYGQVDISLPYQVPDGRYFVMGDNRAVSLDSRVSEVGCVSADQLAGKLELRIWPLSQAGGVR